MIKHFVITRLGLCVYSEHWFAMMIDLFEAVTLASLVNQSNSEFIWLIVIDAHMPSKARDKIEDLLRPYANFHLVPIDVTALRHVRQGCFDWVWSSCQEFILENGLVDDPYDYISTSLIDADDAWHRNTIATVNRFVTNRLPQVRVDEENRGTWLRHTSGIAATFPRGYKWFITAQAWEPMEEPFIGISVFITARFSSNISACSSRHRGWKSYCDILAFETCEIDRDQRMWVYVRHELSTQPWDARATTPIESSTSDLLLHDFGIDRPKLLLWRKKYTQEYDSFATVPVHAGREAASRYDLVFRITALNRLIDAMKRRRDYHCGIDGCEHEALNKIIAENTQRRSVLIQSLRATGHHSDPWVGSGSESP